jgi:CheY-like chemotaxis protein/anti-sigma regulatory factor (Ser/Thr protein kinase)
VALLDTRIREKGLELRFDYRAEKKFYVGDPVRINQIVSNILTNAIKFTSKGFVELSVEGVDGKVLIAVKDTGMGIEADKLETVFENFAQAGKDINRKYGGTGLGLSISRKLAQLMGGNIKVESAIGVGTTFTVVIPLTESKEIKTSVSQELIFSLPASTRILLVEDNPSNQVVASMYLKKKGVQVAIANDGKEAVEMIATKKFDLVLMDLQMPEMDGYEATLLIRAMDDPYFKKIPILALTANVLDDVEAKVLASGMNDCVSKPFKAEELLAKIASHLKLEIEHR